MPEEPAPPAEAIKQMRRHVECEHGRALELGRDVYFAGNEIEGPRLTYTAATPARRARFWCHVCGPGVVFVLGEPMFGDSERNALLRLTDPGLRAGLASVPP